MRWPGVQQSLLTSGSSEDACAQSTEAQKLLRSYDHFSGVLAQPGIAGLIWVATKPQNMGHPAKAKHPGVQSIHKRIGTVLLGIVNPQGLLELRVSTSQVPTEE